KDRGFAIGPPSPTRCQSHAGSLVRRKRDLSAEGLLKLSRERGIADCDGTRRYRSLPNGTSDQGEPWLPVNPPCLDLRRFVTKSTRRSRQSRSIARRNATRSTHSSSPN